jgi:hypothetical protein
MGQARGAEVPAAPSWTTAETDRGYVVFEHNPLERLPADYVPGRKVITDKLSCAMARGEYKSVQFGVYAVGSELQNLRIAVTSDLDVTIYRRRTDFVVPAAPTATAADADKRVAPPSASMYLQRGNALAALPAGASVNFWLTIHAEAGARAGAHPGKIRVEVDGKPAVELDLSVEVRPFVLAPARIPFGMWYARGQYNPDNAAHEWIYRDMAAHSQNSVSFSIPRDFGEADFTRLPLPDDHPMAKIIGLAREAGLVSEHFPCLLESHSLYHEYREGQTGLSDAQLQAAVAWLQGQHQERGWPELIAYGQDEPPVPAPGLREMYTVLRPLPIRLGTAISARAAYAYGDLHDVWIVHDGQVTPELQAEAARQGAQVWTYTYRLWRQGYDPLIQRFYPGLHTWALKLAGNYVWEYYYGYNWVEPVSKETMPTTGWEARREGIDDYRYLQMLEDSIRATPNEPAAVEAAIWLEKLRSRVISKYEQDADGYWDAQVGFPASTARVEPHMAAAGKPFGAMEYEQIRAEAAGYILKLGPASSSARQAAPVSQVKDEAAPFRGRSVKRCIAGLRNSAATTRRSAAWALAELGPNAAPAVAELVKALDDADVRIPALRALEAIGPAAAPAGAKVAALLSHPDDFIRQGAAFTLTALTRIPRKLLAETPELWSFRKDPTKAGEAEAWFLPTVPKDTPEWARISTHKFWEEGYIGHGWYAVDVVIPPTGGKRAWVHFGAVDENYTLWINGVYVADNMDAGTRFWDSPVEAEITGKFTPRAANHIVVRVNNVADAGGIWKPVTVLVEE